jgi:dienelactone hydrolase
MNRRSLAYLVFATCLAVPYAILGQTAAGGNVHKAGTLPRIPAPSGPFGIGRIGYDWTDPSRPDGYSTDPKAHRELMVYFWYPTSERVADARGPYCPGAQQMDTVPEVQSRMRVAFGGNWPAIVSERIFSHAVGHAPVAKSRRQFPVIIFSHGAGGSGFHYTCLIEDLVSRGYVVAAIEHTYGARAVWFPDGRVIPLHEDSPPAWLSPAERSTWMGARITTGINEGAADVRFVLDRLTKMNGDTQGFLLAGRVDLNRAAAMGHSAGAEFAARACQLDARFKACIDLDGGMVPVAALPLSSDGATMKQPLLFLEAYHPESQMGGLSHATIAQYDKTKEEQLQSCPRGTYAVVLKSAGIAHPSFSDIPLLFAGQNEFPETPVALHNLNLIERFVREFAGKNLKQEKAPLLDGGTAHIPEATVERYGH